MWIVSGELEVIPKPVCAHFVWMLRALDLLSGGCDGILVQNTL